MIVRRRAPTYVPGSDATLKIWIDPTDTATSSIQNTAAGAITNGATIGQVTNKAGTSRNFTQWGAITRPTYDSTGINGKGAIRCTSQLLTTQTSLSEFNSMNALTLMTVVKRNAAGGCAFSFTELDNSTSLHDISLVQMVVGANYAAGGRRTTSDAFQTITGNVAPSIFIVTAVFDWQHGKLSVFESGVEGMINQNFQTSGTTGAAEPYAISIGGFAQQTGSSLGSPCDAWVGETMGWLGALTPDQLVPQHHFYRTKYKVN